MNATAAPPSGAVPRLRGSRDFVRLWTASTISELGTSISELALPLVAIITLGAAPFAVGLLSSVEFAPYLLVSLPAGVWVDRARRRSTLIGCDLIRAAVMASVPVAWWAGRLTFGHLCAVAFIVAALTIVFDLAYQAWLPDLVGRDLLVRSNAALQVGEQSSAVAGPGIGGMLVAAVGAPVALLADGVSYLVSAALLTRIENDRDPAVRVAAAAGGRGGLVVEIREGIAFVAGHRVLRALAVTSAITSLFARAVYVLLLVHLVRDAGMGAGEIGLLLALGSAGFVVGAGAADRVVARLGLGRSLTGAVTVIPVALTMLALTIGPAAAPLTVVGFGLYGGAAVVFTVSSLSVRQTAAPGALLGRVNATMRFVSWGSLPLAGIVGGGLGSVLGLTPAMLLCAVCCAAAVVFVLGSSLGRAVLV
jgi:Transmembrane secretion effector